MPKLPRGVSPKKTIALRLSGALIEALAIEESRTGETRTQIVERLLTKGLKMEKATSKHQITEIKRDEKSVDFSTTLGVFRLDDENRVLRLVDGVWYPLGNTSRVFFENGALDLEETLSIEREGDEEDFRRTQQERIDREKETERLWSEEFEIGGS